MEALSIPAGPLDDPGDDREVISTKDFWHAQAMIYKVELQNCNKGLNRLNRQIRRLKRENAMLREIIGKKFIISLGEAVEKEEQ